MLAFDAPALVVAEVPDEFVDLVGCQKVEVAFDFFHGEEMAACIEQVAAPAVAGAVEDGAFGQGNAPVGGLSDVGRKHLHEGHKGVKEAGLVVGADEDAFRPHLQQVAFVAQFGVHRVVEGEDYAVFLRRTDKGGPHMHLA